MKLVSVIYVGNKPHAIDNVARSGKSWEGKGAVQEVTPAQAKLLTGYPDQWQLADPDDAEVVQEPATVTSTNDDDGEEVHELDALKARPVEDLSVAELQAFAQHFFGKKLKSRSRKVLIDEVTELKKTAGMD